MLTVTEKRVGGIARGMLYIDVNAPNAKLASRPIVASRVADVVETLMVHDCIVSGAPFNMPIAETSQSPGVSVIEQMLNDAPLPPLAPPLVAERISPTQPAAALSLVAVPGIWPLVPEPTATQGDQVLLILVRTYNPGGLAVRSTARCIR